MAIESFTFDPQSTDAFISFGDELYRNERYRPLTLKEELRGQLSPECAFYQRASNHHRHFIALKGGEVVGRLSAMINGDLKDKDGTPVGTVGFFECIDDADVSRELLDAATVWLRGEHRIARIWGPINFDIWHGYRLMTRGFGEKPFYGEPFNKPYYQTLFERYGFVAKRRWHSVEVTGHEAMEKMIMGGAPRYQSLIKRGYRFEMLNSNMLRDELRKLHSALTCSFGAFLGFTPITLEEFEHLFTIAQYAFHPRLFTFVYDEHHRLAGFAGAFLDLFEAIRASNGASDLFAQLKCLADSRGSNRILFYLCGMTSEEARRGADFGRALFHYVIRQIMEEGYETVLIALMARGGAMARMAGVNIAAAQREYALYELNR